MMKPLLSLRRLIGLLSLCLLSSWAPDALAQMARSNVVDLTSHANLAQKFVQRVALPWRGRAEVRAIVYGNDQVGWFRTRQIEMEKGQVVAEILPPTYKRQVEFFAAIRKGKGLAYRPLAKRQFKSPVPTLYRKLGGQVESGNFATNYLFVNGSLPKQRLIDPNYKPRRGEEFLKDKYRYAFPMILNRLGEIVWIHVPVYRNAVFSSYLVSKAVRPGHFGLLYGKKAGYFEMVRFDGTVLRRVSSKEVAKPYTMHHDFQMLGPDRILAISSRSGVLKGSGWTGNSARTFMSDKLIEIDLVTGKSKTRIDFLDFYHPSKTPYFTGDEPDDEKFWLWGMPKVDFDFLHINGVEKVGNRGWMVSIRNLNKVAMVDPSLRKIRWTLGHEKTDTFQVQGQAQHQHQHTPVMVGPGRLALFDNGRERLSSRITLFQLDSRSRQAKPVWIYEPKPAWFSKNRSSVAVTQNDRLLAYFVNPAAAGNSAPPIPNKDYIVEIDAKTGKEVARMRRTFETLSPGYRAQPLQVIGRESFVGRNRKSFLKANRS